jgi:hypothetical protein
MAWVLEVEPVDRVRAAFIEIGSFLRRDKCRSDANFRVLDESVEKEMTGFRTYFAMAALAAGVVVWPAHAQEVTEAQKSAIRSNCRSDFMSKCSSVTPGGTEAFQCLKKNEATLSGGCRAAVSAIKPSETPPAAPAAPKPAAAAPAPAPAPAAAVPKPAEPAASVATPTPPKPVQTKPVAAPKPVVATAPAAPTPVAAPPAPTATPGPKLGPLQEARLVRMFCTVDFQTLCKGVRIGEGRVIKCLSDNQPALSPGCKTAIAKIQ